MEEAFQRLRQICLALPEATEKPFGDHTSPSFRVREKIFVWGEEYAPPRLRCKAAPGGQDMLVGMDPERFYVPRYSGHKGWIGVRLDLDPDWDLIAGLIRDSYRLVAPKRLAALLEG